MSHSSKLPQSARDFFKHYSVFVVAWEARVSFNESSSETLSTLLLWRYPPLGQFLTQYLFSSSFTNFTPTAVMSYRPGCRQFTIYIWSPEGLQQKTQVSFHFVSSSQPQSLSKNTGSSIWKRKNIAIIAINSTLQSYIQNTRHKYLYTKICSLYHPEWLTLETSLFSVNWRSFKELHWKSDWVYQTVTFGFNHGPLLPAYLGKPLWF